MYGKPFDHKRDFGTILGGSLYVFEQDGQLYNAAKEPVDENGVPMPLAPKVTLEDIPTTSTQPMPPVEDPNDDIPEDEKPFDILAWAQGDESLKATHFQKVKAEAAMLLGETALPAKKEDIRKAVLAHYGLTA